MTNVASELRLERQFVGLFMLLAYNTEIGMLKATACLEAWGLGGITECRGEAHAM